MVPELDMKIIDNFRAKVHDHNEFIRLYFEDYKGKKNKTEGKDIWSKICSCMDWLTVSVEGFEKPEKNSNMNMSSLNFTHFLVSIDMIIEAVNHLWLSIGEVNKVKQPFINDRSIFNANEFDREYSDEKYFKEIRSWFGVHAVNGNEVKLEGFNEGVRFFSSWSSPHLFNEEEFHVRLYSNNREAENKYGGTKKVRIDELMKFVVLRYSTLTQLMVEIDSLYFQEKKRLQNTLLQFNPNDTELNQIQKLYRQAKERKLTKEHYESQIEDYISFLSCDLNEFSEIDKLCVSRYITDLKPIIPAYSKIVQEVDDTEFEIFDLINMRSDIYWENQYDFSKVFDYIYTQHNPSLGIHCLNNLIGIGFLSDYCADLPYACLHLLIHAKDHECSTTTL